MAPLSGIKVVHLASLGPGPYAAMLLADMGCDVVIIDRVAQMMVSTPQGRDPRRRGQRSIALDLRQSEGREVAIRLIRDADVLIEGMRPGVAERLGLGPDECQAINPGLIYCRVTGWGQDGPLSQSAGHDINYVALTGALGAMGAPGTPPPVPLNLLGDYAGGGVFAALGILAALHERRRTGKGTIVDAAIVDGVASLTAATMGMIAAGRWGERGTNVFDGSLPWYRTYETRDAGYVAVGALEPQFYAALLNGLGLDPVECARDDTSRWPAIEAQFKAIFASQDRSHWEKNFAGTDACVTPVLSFSEAAGDQHNVARSVYIEVEGVLQPAPAPRLGTATETPAPPPDVGRDTRKILAHIGFDDSEVDALLVAGVASQGG